jgi:hypothetical protein
MTKKDIIFYSNFCTYCKEIINEISKTPINDKILYVCVDDENIQLPNFVTAVPTIYLVEKKRIVVDEAIPKWVQEQLSKVESQSNNDIQAYFGSNDSSFGSSFSTLDNKEDKPYISSFTYIGEEQKIETPDDSNDSSSTKSRDSFQNSTMSNDYERLQNERQSEFQNIQRR